MIGLLLTAALALPPAAEAPPPVAMVLNVTGKVLLERDPDGHPVGAMDFLRPGDRLVVPPDGEMLLVFLQDGRRERLKAKARATVGPKGCTPPEAAEAVEGPRLSSNLLQSVRETGTDSAGIRVLRGDGSLPAVVPVVTPLYGATVLTDRPTLSWPPVDGARGYRVFLLSGSEGTGERVLWTAETGQARLAYPEDRKPLNYGLKYRWRVFARMAGGKEQRALDSKFLVITRSEGRALEGLRPLLKSRAPADLLLAALVYQDHGVYGEALCLFERLAERMPQDANVQDVLAAYYERAGRKDRADRARARARKLREAGEDR